MEVGKRFPWVDFMHGLSDLNAFPMYFQIGLHKSSSRLFLITNVYWALSLWKALCLILGIHCLIWTSWQHQEAVLCQSLFNTQGHWIIQRRTWLFVLSSFSHVQLFETLWTVTYQPPLSMGFPRQKYWKKMGYHFILQGIFPTRDGILIYCIGRWVLYHWTTGEAHALG